MVLPEAIQSLRNVLKRDRSGRPNFETIARAGKNVPATLETTNTQENTPETVEHAKVIREFIDKLGQALVDTNELTRQDKLKKLKELVHEEIATYQAQHDTQYVEELDLYDEQDTQQTKQAALAKEKTWLAIVDLLDLWIQGIEPYVPAIKEEVDNVYKVLTAEFGTPAFDEQMALVREEMTELFKQIRDEDERHIQTYERNLQKRKAIQAEALAADGEEPVDPNVTTDEEADKPKVVDFSGLEEEVARLRARLELNKKYLESIKNVEPTDIEQEIGKIFWDISNALEIADRLPEVSEFREFVIDLMMHLVTVITDEKVSWGNIHFATKDGSGHKTLTDILEALHNQMGNRDNVPIKGLRFNLKKFQAPFWGSFFPLAKMIFSTRDFMIAYHQNYRHAKDQAQAMDKLNAPFLDSTLMRIMHAFHTFEDSWNTTVTSRERYSTAHTLYNEYYKIHLLHKKKDDEVLRIAQQSPGFIDRIRKERNLNPSNDFIAKFIRKYPTEVRKIEQRLGHPPDDTDLAEYIKSESSMSEIYKQISNAYAEPIIILYTKAYILRHQERLDGFSRNGQGNNGLNQLEAEFLMANTTPIMPLEDVTRDQMIQSRTAMKILTGLGVLNKKSQSAEAERLRRLLLTPDLRIHVHAKKTTFIYKGEVLTPNHTIYKELKKVIKYGERIEQGSYELSWGTLALPQSDTDPTMGYDKEMIPLLHYFAIALRYRKSNYTGFNFILSRILPRLILPWHNHAEVKLPGEKNLKSLAEVIATKDLNLPEFDNLYTGMMEEFGENSELADNILRAIAQYDLLQNGLFTAADFDSFYLAIGEKVKTSKETVDNFQLKLKVIKYWVECIPLEDLRKILIKDAARLGLVGDILEDKQFGDTEEKRLKAAQEFIIDDIFYDILHDTLVTIVAEKARTTTATSWSEFYKSDQVKKDLQGLKRYLIETGMVRTGSFRYKGVEKIAGLFHKFLSGSGDEKETDLNTGFLASKFKSAFEEGWNRGRNPQNYIVTEEEMAEKSTFNRYINPVPGLNTMVLPKELLGSTVEKQNTSLGPLPTVPDQVSADGVVDGLTDNEKDLFRKFIKFVRPNKNN